MYFFDTATIINGQKQKSNSGFWEYMEPTVKILPKYAAFP